MKMLYCALLTVAVALSSLMLWGGLTASELVAPSQNQEQVLIFLDSQTQKETTKKTAEILEKIPGFIEAQIQTPDQTLLAFADVFPEYAAGLKSDEALAKEIPAVMTATFRPGILSRTDLSLFDPLKSVSGFLSIEIGKSWNKSLQTVRKYILSGATILVSSLLLIVFSLTFLLIYRMVAIDKERIEIMTLCGASPRQIYLVVIKKLLTPTLLAIVIGLSLAGLTTYGLHSLTGKLEGLQLFAQQILPPTSLQLLVLAVIYVSLFTTVLLVSVRFSAFGAYYDE